MRFPAASPARQRAEHMKQQHKQADRNNYQQNDKGSWHSQFFNIATAKIIENMPKPMTHNLKGSGVKVWQ